MDAPPTRSAKSKTMLVVCCNGKALRFEFYWGGRGTEGRLGVEFIVLGREGKIMRKCQVQNQKLLEPQFYGGRIWKRVYSLARIDLSCMSSFIQLLGWDHLNISSMVNGIT